MESVNASNERQRGVRDTYNCHYSSGINLFQKRPKEIEPPLKSDSEEETLQQLQEDQAKKLFQNCDAKVTSKETTEGAGLNLATKRARPNHGEPASVGPKSQEEVAFKQKPKRQTAQEKRKLSCDSCNYNKPFQDD